MQQKNFPSHPASLRAGFVGAAATGDGRLNDCADVRATDPYAGAAVTCVMTLAAASGGIGDELNPPPFPPAAPGPTIPPAPAPSSSRVHIVRPTFVGDPGVRGAGGPKPRSPSPGTSTSSAWNAGFVGVECGSAVMFRRPRYAPPTSRRPLSALAECEFKWATKARPGGDERAARCERARLCLCLPEG